MNRCFLSLRAASRTRSSALGALIRLCVRGAFCSAVFPLAGLLPSTASSAGTPVSFGDFVGTTSASDFSESFIIGVWPWAFPMRPAAPSRRARGDLPVLVQRGSGVLGVFDRAGPSRISRWRCESCCLPPRNGVGTPDD